MNLTIVSIPILSPRFSIPLLVKIARIARITLIARVSLVAVTL